MKLRLSQNNINDLLKLGEVSEKQSYLQELGIKYFLESNGNLICTWATATGKTILGVKIIKKLLFKYKDKEIDIVVPYNLLVNQWQKHFEDYPTVKIFILKTYVKLKRNPFLLIVDECHIGVASESSISTNKILDFGSKFKLLLSATLRKSQIEFLNSKGIKNEFNIPIEESIKLKIVPKLKIYNIGVDFTFEEKKLYYFAVKNEEKSKTFFANHGFDKLPNQCPTIKDVEQKMVNSLFYTGMKARNQRTHLIYKASNKLKILNELNNLLENRKVIYFSVFQNQADEISKIINCPTYHAGSKNSEENLSKFYENEITKISSVMKLIAGFDDACTDTLVRVSYFSAQAGTKQSLGRILREYPQKTALMINLFVNPYTIFGEEIIPSDSIWLHIGLKGLEYETITIKELEL